MAPIQLSPALSTILAALVAGTVAFLASIFSKEQKTSEFRQAWIDGLRNDISEFSAAVNAIHDQYHVQEPRLSREDLIAKLLQSPEIRNAELYKTRINLRLNPREHSRLLDLVKDLNHGQSILNYDNEAHKTKIDDLIEESQKALKSEWVRVKRGEPIFRITKCVSGGIVAIALVAILITAVLQVIGGKESAAKGGVNQTGAPFNGSGSKDASASTQPADASTPSASHPGSPSRR